MLGDVARGRAAQGNARQAWIVGKRRADADSRRFFDEFASVRVSRFRATGVIDPAKRTALIPFPNGKTKLIDTAHTRLKYGGGWSYFVCPKCGKRAVKLWLIDDAPRCVECCAALNIRHASKWGFGRAARTEARDKVLDQLIAKLETAEPLRLKPTPANWRGKAKLVCGSHTLTAAMHRRLIELRLNQLASQQARECANNDDALRTFQPIEATRQLIDITPIWRASSTETLQQALDNAQLAILTALESDDPQQRLNAAKLMLRTKQARNRGI
jgi:hypothetical protein